MVGGRGAEGCAAQDMQIMHIHSSAPLHPPRPQSLLCPDRAHVWTRAGGRRSKGPKNKKTHDK